MRLFQSIISAFRYKNKRRNKELIYIKSIDYIYLKIKDILIEKNYSYYQIYKIANEILELNDYLLINDKKILSDLNKILNGKNKI